MCDLHKANRAYFRSEEEQRRQHEPHLLTHDSPAHNSEHIGNARYQRSGDYDEKDETHSEAVVMIKSLNAYEIRTYKSYECCQEKQWAASDQRTYDSL